MRLQKTLRAHIRAAVRSLTDGVQLGSVSARAGAMMLLIAAVMIAPGRQKAAQDICSVPPKEGCFVQSKIDLAFIIDASGSLEDRGQTYNIEVEGVLRALRNPAVVLRDGSMAVSVVLFSGHAIVVSSLTDINSAADAEAIADKVEAFKCADIHSKDFPPCPAGSTLYSVGIGAASADIEAARALAPKEGARRVFVMITDGQPNDLSGAILAVNRARSRALESRNPFEFDVLLVGLSSTSTDPAKVQEYQTARAAVDQLVSPKPADSLPGATLTIESGPCNEEGATFTGEDCERQANELADKVRSIIRLGVSPLPPLVVNTDADTAPDTPVSETGPISLRQAIESANCNGGEANITFDASVKGKTIHLLSPLPAITQPDVVIDGCDGPNCAPGVTIDGGGQISDGIAIRSNGIRVQGLRIINFTRSGIVSTPVCPSDFISRNVIQNITFENNPTAVLVFDQKTPPREGFNEQIKISHIIASRDPQPAGALQTALIDLGGDGPTPNDAGDPDQGPNTLLNFPDSVTVLPGADNTVTITGQVSGPTAPGATVEIYAITKSHILTGNVVIDGVSFLAETKASNPCPAPGGTPSCASFTATGVTPSPTGNYTATVIDSLGNTSELMFRTDGKPPVGPSASFTTPADFGSVNLNSAPPTKNVDITNDGNAPLQITGCSLARCAPEDPDDTARFTISGCPAAGTLINPGQKITVTVTFATNICGPAKACLFLASNDLLHSPIVVTLTGSVGGNGGLAIGTDLDPVGPVEARSKRRKPKKFKKLEFQTFSLTNLGCNARTLTFQSIKRVTDVANCDITDANADDRRLWVITQVKPGSETVIDIGSTASVPIGPGETLTFNAHFNPQVPVVVNKNCAGGNLTAEEVLPDEVESELSILLAGGDSTPEAVTVPLTGEVTTEVRLIDPANPGSSPLVKLCRNGNEFIVEFSVYDSNRNVDRATYQFMDSAGRIVGQVFDISLSQAIAARDLATGQSFTVSQRFTGASDNSQIVSVQVTVFDGDDTSDGASSSGQLSSGCTTTP